MIKARFEGQKKLNSLTKGFSRARSLSFFSDKKNVSVCSRIKKDNSKRIFSVDEKTHRKYLSKKSNLQANQRYSSYTNEVSGQECSVLNIKNDDESKDRILIHIGDESKKDNDNEKISSVNYSYSSDTKKKSDEEKSERKIMIDILEQLKVSNAHNSKLIQKMDVTFEKMIATFERMDKREEATIRLFNMMQELIMSLRPNSGNVIGSNNIFNKNTEGK
jgi:hypothetical protein